MMIERVNANSPAQAVKSRARGPTITQLRAKQAALVAAAELAASSDAEARVVRPPVDEAKRWASGKGRKVGFAKARATFRGGGPGIAKTAAKHDSRVAQSSTRAPKPELPRLFYTTQAQEVDIEQRRANEVEDMKSAIAARQRPQDELRSTQLRRVSGNHLACSAA